MTQRPDEKAPTRQITPPDQTRLSEVDWERFAAYYTNAARWIPTAIERLKSGDVSSTQHGMRVRVREDWGERWEGAAAFWPKKKRYGWYCRCDEFLAYDMCSHLLAALMYQAWLKECADAANQSRAETDTKTVRPVEDWFK